MKYFSSPIRFKNDPSLKTYILLVSIIYLIFIISLKVLFLVTIILNINNFSVELIILIIRTKEAIPISIYVFSTYLIILYLLYLNSIIFLIGCLVWSNRWFYQDLILYTTLFYNTNFVLFDYLYLNFIVTITRFLCIQIYNAYLVEPPICYIYISFKSYSKTRLLLNLGLYFDKKGFNPRWWANQIYILKVCTDLITLLLLPSWIVLYISLMLTNFPIIFEKNYLSESTITPFKIILIKYTLLPLKLIKAFKIRYKIADVVHLFMNEGLPYLRYRGLAFSTTYGWSF